MIFMLALQATRYLVQAMYQAASKALDIAAMPTVNFPLHLLTYPTQQHLLMAQLQHWQRS